MRVLVVGSTGNVGRYVVEACRARGLEVRALVRDGRRAPPGVEVVEGDLRRPEDVRAALDGVDAAFYLSPHIDDEERVGLDFLDACGERRLVFLGSHVDGPNAVVRWLLRAMLGWMIPRYRAKWRLSERARRRGARVLAPTNFFQNDELEAVARPLREGGGYVYPVGEKGMNRVDALDIGEVAARLLVDDSLGPGAYPVYGARSWTGAECAAAWGEALGRHVPCLDDGEAFAAGIRETLEGAKRDDLLETWSALRRLGVPTQTREVARTRALLGRDPTGYVDYVARTSATFRRAGER